MVFWFSITKTSDCNSQISIFIYDGDADDDDVYNDRRMEQSMCIFYLHDKIRKNFEIPKKLCTTKYLCSTYG